MRIFLEVFLSVIGTILWKKGSELSKTYDVSKPIWERPPITDEEFYGKFLEVLSVFVFTIVFSLIARWLIEYYNIY